MSQRNSYFAIGAGIGLFVVAALALVQVTLIPTPSMVDGLGPRALPGLVAGLFLILTAGYTQAAYKGRSPDVADDPEQAARIGGLERGAWLVLGLISLVGLIPFAGIGVAGIIAFSLFARGFGSTQILRDAGVALLFVGGVWLLFQKLLGVQLGPFLGPYVGY